VFNLLFTRRPLATAGLALGALTALATHPTWASSLGVDVWNVPALKAEIRANAERDRQLNELNESTLQRIEVKETIIAALLARQISLAEATDRFTAINASQPACMELIRQQYAGKTDQEKLARNVMAFVQLRVSPAEWPAVRRRLEAELRQMLAGSAGL
jgi:hypothetical protein